MNNLLGMVNVLLFDSPHEVILMCNIANSKKESVGVRGEERGRFYYFFFRFNCRDTASTYELRGFPWVLSVKCGQFASHIKTEREFQFSSVSFCIYFLITALIPFACLHRLKLWMDRRADGFPLDGKSGKHKCLWCLHWAFTALTQTAKVFLWGTLAFLTTAWIICV